MQIIYNNIRAESSKATAQAAHQLKTNNAPLSFKDVLDNTMEESCGKLQFSKHANMRLSAREIDLSAEQMKRVESGVNKAWEKGIKDSLVLVDNVALVVNIRNKMVITAIQQADDHIFTNIDGAVIV